MRIGKSAIVVAGVDIPYPTAEQADTVVSTLNQCNEDWVEVTQSALTEHAQPQKSVLFSSAHIKYEPSQ